MPLKIQTVSAFISTDAEGNEGLCACLRGGVWYPMVKALTGAVRLDAAVIDGEMSKNLLATKRL